MAENKLDDFFKDKLEDLRYKPSTDVWDRISESLDKKDEKVRSFQLIRWSAAASVLLVGVGIYWFLNNTNQNTAQLISANVLPSVINPIQEEKQEERIHIKETETVKIESTEITNQVNATLVSEVKLSQLQIQKNVETQEELQKDENSDIELIVLEDMNLDNSTNLISTAIDDELLDDKHLEVKKDEALTSPRIVITVKLDEKPQEKKRKVDANKILRRLNDLRKGYELNTQASNRKKGDRIN